MATDRLDVIIFGATGFTGRRAVANAVKLLGGLKWGIAGRNDERLMEVLKEVGQQLDKNLLDIPIAVADVNDENSLLKMAECAKIVVNCCGPYRFYGEPVIKACLNARTHHIDVSGEPQFMERMQVEYNDMAKHNGVYIVSACGFDSIPADLGTIFFEKHFDGDVHAIESYLKFWNDEKSSGAMLHYGTWESAVYGLAHADELRVLRQKLCKEPLPYSPPKQRPRPMIHKSKLVRAWCLPFLGSDRSVVQRTQRYLYENEKKRPVQYQTYIQFPSFFVVALTVIVSTIFGLLAKFPFGRNLLLKYPKVFSLGTVSHEGPTEQRLKNTNFSLTFYGDGWPKEEQLTEGTDKHTRKPSKKLETRVFCKDPGYGSTTIALLLAAITILQETDKLPGNGGVLPPGACFAKTNLISKLCDNGFKFEVLSGNEEPEKEKTN